MEGAGQAGGGLEVGLASHGGRAEPAVEPAWSVRTSESAARHDLRDWGSGPSRAGLKPASPPPSAPSASQAGRRLVEAEKGA